MCKIAKKKKKKKYDVFVVFCTPNQKRALLYEFPKIGIFIGLTILSCQNNKEENASIGLYHNGFFWNTIQVHLNKQLQE